MSADITTIEMSSNEENRLVELEQVVEDGMAQFVAVGNALAEISEGRLYRATHSTFEAYVQDRYGISRSYAYRKINAAHVAEIVSPIGDSLNESQARELSGLNDPQVQAAHLRALELQKITGKLTAQTIREAREQVAPKMRPAIRWHKQDSLIDPNQFIDWVTLFGAAAEDELTKSQYTGLDWSRLNTKFVPDYISIIDAHVELLLKIRDRLVLVDTSLVEP